MTPRQFLEEIVSVFGNALIHFTDPGIQVTEEQTGPPHPASWTNELCELHIIQWPEPFERFIALEKILTTLYCFYLSVKTQHYTDFTEAQYDLLFADRLSQENYDSLCAALNTFLMTDNHLADVLPYLPVCSGLGKSPVVRAQAEAAGVNAALAPDDLMLGILQLDDEEIIKILPDFSRLNATARAMLKTAWPLMTVCFGHLYFLEGGTKTLTAIARIVCQMDVEKRQMLLELVFWAQFYQGVGAQGQFRMMGSATCTNHFYQSYMLLREILFQMEKHLTATGDIEKSVAAAMETYLSVRASWIGLQTDRFKSEAEFGLVLRLACMLRIAVPASAAILANGFDKLEPAFQILLTEQLGLSGHKGVNLFAGTPRYMALALQNSTQAAFAQQDVELAVEQALQTAVCLAMLVREITEKYKLAASDTSVPLSFGEFAARASEWERAFCDPFVFDASFAGWMLPRPSPAGVIKNLVFDLNHVFIRTDPDGCLVFEAFAALTQCSHRPLLAAEVEMIFNESETAELIAGFYCGKVSAETFRACMTKKLGVTHLAAEAFDQAFNACMLADPAEVRQRLAYLERLVMRGYRLYLLSNTNPVHLCHIKNYYGGNQWGKYFIKQYFSHETGKSKPDAAAYLQVLEENRLKVNETLFFDGVEQYVDACMHGMRARPFSVDTPVADIELIIDAVDKNEKASHATPATESPRAVMLSGPAIAWVGQQKSHDKLSHKRFGVGKKF